MKFYKKLMEIARAITDRMCVLLIQFVAAMRRRLTQSMREFATDEQGDVPGWVLVVLMTTGLVTAIWTIAAPRLSAILKNSLDSMNGIR